MVYMPPYGSASCLVPAQPAAHPYLRASLITGDATAGRAVTQALKRRWPRPTLSAPPAKNTTAAVASVQDFFRTTALRVRSPQRRSYPPESGLDLCSLYVHPHLGHVSAVAGMMPAQARQWTGLGSTIHLSFRMSSKAPPQGQHGELSGCVTLPHLRHTRVHLLCSTKKNIPPITTPIIKALGHRLAHSSGGTKYPFVGPPALHPRISVMNGVTRRAPMAHAWASSRHRRRSATRSSSLVSFTHISSSLLVPQSPRPCPNLVHQ